MSIVHGEKSGLFARFFDFTPLFCSLSFFKRKIGSTKQFLWSLFFWAEKFVLSYRTENQPLKTPGWVLCFIQGGAELFRQFFCHNPPGAVRHFPHHSVFRKHRGRLGIPVPFRDILQPEPDGIPQGLIAVVPRRYRLVVLPQEIIEIRLAPQGQKAESAVFSPSSGGKELPADKIPVPSPLFLKNPGSRRAWPYNTRQTNRTPYSPPFPSPCCWQPGQSWPQLRPPSSRQMAAKV